MISRKRFAFVTDTGGNDKDTWGGVYGHVQQVAYTPAGDTGVLLDTGAVLTITVDTGGLSQPLLVTHMPATGMIRGVKIPQLDTGGAPISGVDDYPVLAGEKLTASLQGIATDTGKEGTVNIYIDEG